MKKRVIKFDERAYLEKKQYILQAIELLNKTNFTLEQVKEIIRDRDKFNLLLYLSELKEICQLFAIDYEQAKLFDPSEKYKMFKNMASNKTKLQRKKTNELYRIASLSGFNIADFIGQDGTFVLLDDNLREYFTSYTESEKENNLLDLTLKLQSLYKEFEKNGVMKDDCNLLIDNALEIDTNALKLLSK